MPPDPLRILLLSHGLPPEFRGGTESYVERLARFLSGTGREVRVICGTGESADRVTLHRQHRAGFDVVRVLRSGLFADHWSRSFAPEVEAAVLREAEGFRPHVVHLHHWARLSRVLVAPLAAAGFPVVVTLHDLWSDCPRSFRVRDETLCRRPLSAESCLPCVPRERWHEDGILGEEIELYRDDLREELRRAARILVPSMGHGKALASGTGIPEDRFLVLPPGPVSDLPRAAGGPGPPHQLRLAHWGHLQPLKGLHLLLEAARELSVGEQGRLTIDVFGEADDSGYERRLKELGAGLKVRWHGAFLPTTLAQHPADWAVFPSVAQESWSFVLDEAFQLGWPVVVPRRGAFTDRVQGSGLFFEPESVTDLTRVLRELLADDGHVKWSEARDQIPPTAPFATHGEALVGVYDDVLSRWTRGSPTLDRELSDRHRRHRSRRIEGLESQLLDALGRVEQETDRADGLVQAFAKAEAAARTRETLLSELHRSVSEHRTTLLETQAALSAVQDDLRHVSHDREVERARLHGEMDSLARDITRLRGDYETLQSVHERAVAESQRRIADLASAHESDQHSIRGLLAARDEDRQAREAAGREVQKLERRLEDVQVQRTRLEQELMNAQQTAQREALGLAALDEDLQRSLGLVEELGERVGVLEAERERWNRDRHQLEGQRARLKAELEFRSTGEGEVAERLGNVLQEIGLPAVPATDPLDQIRLDSRRLAPEIRKNRETLERLAKTVDALGDVVQRRETERERLVARLKALDEDRERRRKSWFFRWAEKFTGVGTPADSRPGDRLRILMVVHDFLPRHAAGSEIYTYRLAKALSRDHDVHLLFTEAHPGVHSYGVRDFMFDGLPCIEVSHQHTTEFFERTWRDPQMNLIFERVLDRLKPDVLHVQHLHHHSIDYLPIAKKRGVAICYTLHEYLLLCPRGGQMLREDLERCEVPIPARCADCITHYSLGAPGPDEGRVGIASRVARYLPDDLKQVLRRALGPARSPESGEGGGNPEGYAAAIEYRLTEIKQALDHVDLLVSPSEFLKGRFLAAGLVQPGRILVSHNGQDTAPFEGLRRTVSDDLRVGYIGTISDYKGVHVVVRALNRLIQDRRITCDIWGKLETFPEYGNAMQTLSQNPRLRFRGRYAPEEVGQVLAEIDVLVVPSLWYENSPLTIHEAAMARVPVVASDLGGMAELVEDGVAGLLFPPGDDGALAEVLRRLDQDRSLLRTLGDRAMRVKSIERDATDMVARYRDILAGRTEGRG